MTNKGKMIEAIYLASLTKRATLVIFYLINRANQELTCFPSVGTIASECNMSRRTVQRALTDLEKAGFLERESRFFERGGQRSSLFRLKYSEVDQGKEVIKEIDFVNHREDIYDIRKDETDNYVKPLVSKVIVDVLEISIKNEAIEDKIKRGHSNPVLIYTLNRINNRFKKIVSWGLRHVFIP